MLNVTDDSSSRNRQSDAEIESSGTGAEGEDPDGTKIHNSTLPFVQRSHPNKSV
mgnify:FL=1